MPTKWMNNENDPSRTSVLSGRSGCVHAEWENLHVAVLFGDWDGRAGWLAAKLINMNDKNLMQMPATPRVKKDRGR
jgi:hypothetical protein